MKYRILMMGKNDVVIEDVYNGPDPVECVYDGPDPEFVPEGYEVNEIDGKFVISEIPATPAEEEPTEDPTDQNIEDPTDQTSDEIEEPVEPLGETYTETVTITEVVVASPSVPNTGDHEEIKETSSTKNIDLLLIAFALGFTALLVTVVVKSKKTSKEVIY